MLGNEAFWEFQKNGTKKSKIDQLYQRKRKGDKDLENVHCSRQKKAGDNREPHNKHTIDDQGYSWATPVKNCLSAVFKCSFNRTSYMLGN